MKPWVEVLEVVDSGRGVLATTRVPSFAYESCGMGAGGPLPVPDCAWCLAEIVLTVLDKFATVGARDPGTLQDLFGHYFGTNAACRPGWDDNYGPLPGSRRLNEVQFASILQLSDQYRAKFGSDATPCTFAYRYGSGSGDALQRFEKSRVQIMQRKKIQLVSGNKQALTSVPPVAMECMAFTCATVEEVPVMVSKLMAVCSSDTVGHGQVRPFELQFLQHKAEVLTARVVMHVHRLVADEVAKVPDWARPYPSKDDRPGDIQLRAQLPDWDEGSIAAPLAHSVHLAALLHAWFQRCLKGTTKRCRKFLDLVTSSGPADLLLTEEQQHILLELSEEYLALHRNGWRNEPKGAAAERHDSPTSVEAVEFPTLGASPTRDACGRTTYLQSMFAISKPATRPTDFEKLWTVAWLGPSRKDRIWLTGPKAHACRHTNLPPDHARISGPNSARRAIASW